MAANNPRSLQEGEGGEVEKMGKMCTVKKENPMIKANPASLAKSLKLYEGDSAPWTNDTYMAGYLGFSDRSEYLKFLLSPPVLDLFRFSRPYLLSKGWLEVLQYKYRESDPESFGSYQDITKEHPFGGEDLKLSKVLRTANQDFGLAKLVCKGYTLIQQFYQLPSGQRQKYFPQAAKKFTDAFNLKVPAYDINTAKSPMLGPLDSEDLLEKFNRVCYVLKALKHTSSPSKWKNHGFENPQLTSEPMGIPLQALPRWMRKKKEGVKQQEEETRDRFPAKDFPLKWDKFWGTKENKETMQKHIAEYLDENNIEPPPELSKLKHDPRYFESGAQWRDTLRTDLELQTSQLDLAFIDFEIAGAERVNVFGRPKGCFWDEALELLREKAVSIRLRLKVVGDDWEYIPEYDGPPIEVAKFMPLNEEHVLLSGPASISDQSPAVAESSTSQDRLTGTPLVSSGALEGVNQ